MGICGANVGVSNTSNLINCTGTNGCSAVCPDFTLKRNDIRPAFRVSITDCNGPLDLTNGTYVLEVNIWANAKLKTDLSVNSDYFALADNIGFDQIMVGDILMMQRARLPEYMLVIGFDEYNKLVKVQRGYFASPISQWKKGNSFKIFKAMGSTAQIETTLEDITQEDGTILKDQLTNTSFVYNWSINNTCLSGCYWLEFKLLKMIDVISMQTLSISVVPSFTPASYTSATYGCKLGDGVEWVRRFPENAEGFYIQILESPTQEI